MKGRIIRIITEYIARKNKVSFVKHFDSSWLNNDNTLDHLTIISFSGEKQFADQLYSIASFYINVGKPGKWTIYSDGSHSKESRAILDKLPGVLLVDWGESIVPAAYRNETNKLIKKIFNYRTVQIDSTTIFIDSDVLFYKKFVEFLPFLRKRNWFIVDEYFGALDEPFKTNVGFDMYPCNSGFLIFNTQPNWEIVMDYLNTQLTTKEGLQNWSEQTAFHLLTRGFKEFLPLEPKYFVVDGSDSFKYKSDFDYDKIAVRHFVGPIRHKMWQYPWKKILDIQ